MTDWREAGRKADAHRVRDLYRGAFGSDAKDVARQRVIEALRAAGVTTVLDLWGGGISAAAFVAAGFKVISVDDGSMELMDHDRPVTRARKRRALEYVGIEGGYETRFGKVETFAAEADGAYLDFCGPWTAATRRTIKACRHMKAVAVTLTPDHDVSSDASTSIERQMAYQLFLRMAWQDRPAWTHVQPGTQVRRLLDYRRARGFMVYLYLLSARRIHLPPLTSEQRAKTNPSVHARIKRNHRAYYYRHRDEILARERAARIPIEASCLRCGTLFIKRVAQKYCSVDCAKAAKADQQRARQARLSGVSGTPDEAIKD